MFTEKEFDEAIVCATAQLRKVEAELKKLTCPEIAKLTIRTAELSSSRIAKLLESIPTGYSKKDKGTDYVYVIQVPDAEIQKVDRLMVLFESERTNARDYSRLNTQNKGTKTLYVGRSRTLRARLNQHLGTGGEGVYSLHLQRWATPIDVSITIYIMSYSNTADLLVQAVEDGLWAALRPAFGRKGEK